MTNHADFLDMNASQQANAIRNKRISSHDLVIAALARIEETNTAANFAVEIDADGALARAQAFDRGDGPSNGALAGIPITIKDTICVEGFHCTAGSEMLRDYRPDRDAYAVARLREAGAIVIAKTNVPPFAGDVQTDNNLFGATANPYDLSRTSGGSSGGAAVSVALGSAAIEIGSDIGGSIRTPAHYCGIVGHRPTFGIVPLHGHIPGPPGTINDDDLATVGPLGRTVQDIELALQLIAGPEPDFFAGKHLGHLVEARPGKPTDYRVAVLAEVPGFPVDEQTRLMMVTLKDKLSEAGVDKIETVEMPFDAREMHSIYLSMLYAVFAGGMTPDQKQEMATIAAPMEEHNVISQAAAARGVSLTHSDWLQYNQMRSQYRRKWRDLFMHYDILLCPVIPSAAPLQDKSDLFGREIAVDASRVPQLDGLFWAGIHALSYLPATSVPVMMSQDGLPLGVQVTAGFREDLTALSFAKVIEQACGSMSSPSQLTSRLI